MLLLPAKLKVLIYLKYKNPSVKSVKEIAEDLGIRYSTCYMAIQDLQNMGLIKDLRITKKGEAILKNVLPVIFYFDYISVFSLAGFLIGITFVMLSILLSSILLSVAGVTFLGFTGSLFLFNMLMNKKLQKALSLNKIRIVSQ